VGKNAPDKTNHKHDAQARHWVDILHGPATAWIILAISLLITLIAWKISDNYAEQRAKERFEFQIEEAQNAILKRFINYEQVLRGGLGLFKSSSHVNREEWKSYVSILDIDTFFPGTLGVGYSVWLPAEQLNNHISTIRQLGFTDFEVRPKGQREYYSSIIYLEPFNERNQRAFGFDMFSEPVRREAMTRARDSGKTSLSGKVTLVQETNAGVQAGFLIYMPHYNADIQGIEERREALVGFVYSALRVGDLMQGILGVGLPELDFTIYDGQQTTAESFLYDTETQSEYVSVAREPRFQVKQLLDIGGHVWSIDYRSNKVFDAVTATSQPSMVAIGGVIIDLLLFYIILSLGRLRKRAQALADKRMQELSERELQFKAITDNANDGIISVNEHGNMTYLNQSAQKIFGYNLGMIIGRPISMLFSVAQKSVVEEVFNRLQETPDPSINNSLLELDGINSQSESFSLEFSLARWQTGDRSNYTAIVRDITERKKIERIKNEFISTVSHELRTPLTAISGSLSLIEHGVGGKMNEQSQALVKNASRNASRLTTLVNDLLDSEKMASGNMRYNMQVCEISDLVKKSLESNQPVAEQEKILLDFSETAAVNACVDPDRFIQVMTNLLANAIKFSPEGGIIKIRVTSDEKEIQVSVTDYGIGIPDEFRSQIFNKFAQADSSDTRKHGGTGLGLSIVKFIIEKFNGRIDYRSVPGKETTFFFHIPIAHE